MTSFHFKGKPINITVIQAYAPNSNAKEAVVELLYEDIEDLLEGKPRKNALFVKAVQFSSVAQVCPTFCDPVNRNARPLCPSLTPRGYPSMSIESVMPSNHIILCCPLLLKFSVFPSIRDFSNESALHKRWSKNWSFSFNISPSNEHSGLISFRIG